MPPYNPDKKSIPPQNELADQQEILRARRFLEEQGEDLSTLNLETGPDKAKQMDYFNNAPAVAVSPGSVDSTLYNRFLEQSLRQDGHNVMADSIANQSTSGHRPILPGDVPARVLHPVIENVRRETRNMRTNISIGAVDAADGVSFWKQTFARMIGSDPAQIAMGGIEPLARAQQVLYGALKGEGWAAWSRLFPTVTLEDVVDENGIPVEMSPWSATMDAVWSKIRGDEDAAREDIEILRRVNIAYMQDPQLLEFSDVVDSTFGEEGMDQFYENMYDAGFMGKVAMGATALTYAAGEMFADPLIIFDFAPTLVTKGMKAGMSTARRAEMTAKVARKTRKLPDVLEARKQAGIHLNKAHAEVLRENTHKTRTNLKNAMALFAERQDEVEWLRRQGLYEGGDQFDIIHYPGVGKRNPSTISTLEETTETGRVVGAGNAWERGMMYDFESGRPIDFQSEIHPIRQFRRITGQRFKIEAIGKPAEAPHSDLIKSLEAFGERLGMRVIPYRSSGHKTQPLMLGGQYWPGSRTVWLNTAISDPHQILTSFLHESWHHVFYTYMSDINKTSLVDNMRAAGFDFDLYRKDMSSLNYYFPTDAKAADEFSARSLSDMATDVEFWDTLRRLDPEAFEHLSHSAEQLALMSVDHVDRVKGLTSKQRMNVNDPAGQLGWIEHTEKVMGAIDDAYKRDPILLEKHRQRITKEVRETIDTLSKQRESIQATGRNTPMIDAEIERAQKYLDRLYKTGNRGRMADFKWKAEQLLRRTPQEIRSLMAVERKMAALRGTEVIQPNRQPTWTKVDGEWVEAVIEQADMFADTEAASRLALGPDDAEYAAEGLARLVHGADPDDFLAPIGVVPERSAATGGRIVPGTKDNMIDLQAINDTVWNAKKEARARNLELWEYDSGASFLDEALNELKAADPPKRFKGPKADTLNELDAMPKKKARKYRKVPYDDAWLPKPRKKAEQIMADGWWDTYQMNNYDRVATALYPHTWRIKWPAGLRAGVMHLREPMRVLEDVDPGRSWPLIRGALYNAESETTRLVSVFNGAMEQFGAIRPPKKAGTLRKAFFSREGARHSPEVVPEMSELLFDILDTSKSSKQYAKLTEDLTSKQRQAVANIRHELDLIADRLGIQGTDAFIDGYIHHAFNPSNFSKGQALPEFAGMSKSGNVFLAALLKRNGNKGFEKDAAAALEVYARGVSRKLHLEPALQRFKKRAQWYANRPGGRDKFFADYADMMIAQLNGEPSMMGKVIDKMASGVYAAAGKPYQPGQISRGVLAMNNLIYTSLLAGNRRYPIMSIATALSTTGAKYGLLRTVKGIFKMATPEGQLLFKQMNGDQQFRRIFESELMDKFGTMVDKLGSFRPMTLSTYDSEQFIRGMTFWASIDDNLTKLGYSNFRMADEAGFGQSVLFDAMRQTEEINHYFGILGKTPAFGRFSKSGSALATQFLSFPFKQAETLIGLGKEDPGYIFRFMMLSGWVARVASQELGMDVQEYVGLSAAVPRPGALESPGVALVGSMARAMATLTDMGEGYASAEEAKSAVDQFLKDSEVLVPMLRLGREVAQAMEMDATGRKETPGRGFGRDINAEYINVGDRFSFPIPSGSKGNRNEVASIGMGGRSIQETMTQKAKARIRQVVNEAAIERMSLVEKAKQAMDSGDWNAASEQMRKMAEQGFPIGDLSDPIKTKMEIDILDWHITELKRNPKLAHKIVPILQQYGIIGGENANTQNGQ